jgi:isopropylmalate/homocitrate/citramalate synthase
MAFLTIKINTKMSKTNWTVEKKDEIEKTFINLLASIGMDVPSNFEDIVQHIYEDVCETADPVNWSQGDVVIGFRRWIESKG